MNLKMKKRRVRDFLLAGSLILGMMLTGCGMSGQQTEQNGGKEQNKVENEKISVVATIFPQYDFVRQIAGENVELKMLLKPGEETHSYEPTPQDIIAIQNSDLFIYVGGENDAWVEMRLSRLMWKISYWLASRSTSFLLMLIRLQSFLAT